MEKTQFIKQRSPELLIQELKEELKARISEGLYLVKDIRAEEKDNFRARCALYAYEDIFNLIIAMEEDENIDIEESPFIGEIND